MSNLFGYELSAFTQKALILMDKDDAAKAHRKVDQLLPRLRRLVPSKDDESRLVPMQLVPESQRNNSPILLVKSPAVDDPNTERKAKKSHRVAPLINPRVMARQFSPFPQVSANEEFLFKISNVKRNELEIQKMAKKLFSKAWVSPHKLALVGDAAMTCGPTVLGPVKGGTTSVDNFHHRYFLRREQARSEREEERANMRAAERVTERQRVESLNLRLAEKAYHSKLASFSKRQSELVEERIAHDKLIAHQRIHPNTCSPNLYESCGPAAPLMCCGHEIGPLASLIPGQRVQVRSLAYVKAFQSSHPTVAVEPSALNVCGRTCYFLDHVMVVTGTSEVEFVHLVDLTAPVRVVLFPLACIMTDPKMVNSPLLLSNHGGMFKLASLSVNAEILGEQVYVETKLVWKPPAANQTNVQTMDLLYVQPQRQELDVMSVAITVGERNFKTCVISSTKANEFSVNFAQRRNNIRSGATLGDTDTWIDTFECDGVGHHDMLLLPIANYDRAANGSVEIITKYMLHGHWERQGVCAVLPLAFPRLALLESTARKGLHDIGGFHVVYGGLNYMNTKTLRIDSSPKTKIAKGTTSRTMLFADASVTSAWSSSEISISYGIEKQSDFNLLCWIEAGPTATRRDNFVFTVFPPHLTQYNGPLFRRNMCIVLDISHENIPMSCRDNYLAATAVLLNSLAQSETCCLLVVLTDGFTLIETVQKSPETGKHIKRSDDEVMSLVIKAMQSPAETPALDQSQPVNQPLPTVFRRCVERFQGERTGHDEVKSIVIFTTRTLDADVMRTYQLALDQCTELNIRIHTCTSYQPTHNGFQGVFWRQLSHSSKGEHVSIADPKEEMQHLLQFIIRLDRPVLLDVELSFAGLFSLEVNDTSDITMQRVTTYSGKYTYVSAEKSPEHISISARFANDKVFKKRVPCLRIALPLAKVIARTRLTHLHMTLTTEILTSGGHFRDVNNDLVSFSSQYGIPYAAEHGNGTSLVFYETARQPKVLEKDTKKSSNTAGSFLNSPSPGGSVSGKSWPEYYNYTVNTEVRGQGAFLTIGTSLDVLGSKQSESSFSRKWVLEVMANMLHFERLIFSAMEDEASERFSFDLEECTDFTNMNFEWTVKRLWIQDQQVILECCLFEHETLEQNERTNLYAQEYNEWNDFLLNTNDIQQRMATWNNTSVMRRTELFTLESEARKSIEDHQMTLWRIGSALISGEVVTHDLVARTLGSIKTLRVDIDDVIYALHVIAVWSCMRLAGELSALEGAVSYLKWCLAWGIQDQRTVVISLDALTNLALIVHNQGKIEASSIIFEVQHSVMVYLSEEIVVLTGLAAMCSLMVHSTKTRSILANSHFLERMITVPLTNYATHTPIMRKTFELALHISTQPQSHGNLVRVIVPTMCTVCLTILSGDMTLRKTLFQLLANTCSSRLIRTRVADARLPLVLVANTFQRGREPSFPPLSGSLLARIVKCLDKMTGNTSDAAAGCILEACADTLHDIVEGNLDIAWGQGIGQKEIVLIEVRNFLRRLLLVTPALPQNVYMTAKTWVLRNPQSIVYYVPFASLEVLTELPYSCTPYRYALPFHVKDTSTTRSLISFSTSRGVVGLVAPEGTQQPYDATLQLLKEVVGIHSVLFHPNLCCLVGWTLHDDVLSILYPLSDTTAAEYFVTSCGSTNHPITWETVCSILWEITDALDYLHTCGVVHRMVSPQAVHIDCATTTAMLCAPLVFGDVSVDQAADLFTDEVAKSCVAKVFRDDLRDLGHTMLTLLVGPSEAAAKGCPEGCPPGLWEGIIGACLGPDQGLTVREVRTRMQAVLQEVMEGPLRNKIVM